MHAVTTKHTDRQDTNASCGRSGRSGRTERPYESPEEAAAYPRAKPSIFQAEKTGRDAKRSQFWRRSSRWWVGAAFITTFPLGCAEPSAPLLESKGQSSDELAPFLPTPVALFHLDEDCSQTTVFDASGNGANGLRYNGAGCTSGKVDRAASFDKIDDRIEVPDRPSFHFTTKMTVAAWVNPSSAKGLQAIVNKWYAKDSYALYQNDGQFGFSVALPDGGWGTTYDVTAEAAAGVWSHVAGVYDGTSIAIYVNGTLSASRVLSAQAKPLQDSTRPIVIGNHPSWNAYEGKVDEVRLYDEALSAAQIKALTRDTYYVATTGLDTNPGTMAKPFRTLTRAGKAAKIGDTVYVRGGVYYTGDQDPETGQLVPPVKFDEIGTEQEPIVVRAYPGEKVVLDGSKASASDNTDLLQIRGRYYEIIGFEMRAAKKIAINLSKYDGTGGQHIRIAGNTIHDSYKGAIYPGKTSTHLRFENNVVYNNVKINEDKLLYCHKGMWPSAVNLTQESDIVVGNKIYENWGEGLGVYGTGHYVADNELHDNYSVDIYMSNVKDATVERNFVYSLDKPSFQRLYCPAGVSCPDLSTWTTCPWPQDQRVPAAAIGIEFANEDPNAVQLDNNHVVNNIVVGLRRAGLALAAWTGTGPADLKSSVIEHNTIVGEALSELFGIVGPAPTSTGPRATIANNIFYQLRSDRPLARMKAANVVRIDFLNNNWFGGDGTFSSTGPGTSPGDVLKDPLLVNPRGSSAADFKLTASSPDIDSGALRSIVTDYFGTQRPQGKGYDIGALEVVQTTSPALSLDEK